MSTPRFRLYIAVSLDGFVADAKGDVHWLDPYQSEDLGFDRFLGEIGAIVMGRATYDQAVGFSEWPYGGKRIVVMTHRPLTPSTPDTEVYAGPVEDLADRLARETATGDVWVLGGGKIARAFLAAGRLDTVELYVIPLLLGMGIPLFGPGTVPASLEPQHVQAYANGIVRLDYEVRR